MSKKDLEMKAAIRRMLESGSSGEQLIEYFAELPDKRIRRAISVLSDIYPDKITISDDEFSFVLFMFSDERFMQQESFAAFVRAVNILRFTEHQKKQLIGAIKHTIEMLCDICTFELNALLVNIFELNELFQYLKVLAEQGSRHVLQQISLMLQYEDFSNSRIAEGEIEDLKQKVSEYLNR